MTGHCTIDRRYSVRDLTAAARDLAQLRFEVLRGMMSDQHREVTDDMLRTQRLAVEQAIQQRHGGEGPVAVLQQLLGQVWDRESAMISALLLEAEIEEAREPARRAARR